MELPNFWHLYGYPESPELSSQGILIILSRKIVPHHKFLIFEFYLAKPIMKSEQLIKIIS